MHELGGSASSHPALVLAVSMDGRKVNPMSKDRFRVLLELSLLTDFRKLGLSSSHWLRAFHGEGLEARPCHKNPVMSCVSLEATTTEEQSVARWLPHAPDLGALSGC